MVDAHLNRFVEAQESLFMDVLAELNAEQKTGHWMWFIFPQLKGLGMSSLSEFYGLSGRLEASAYLHHELLGLRLKEVVSILLHAKETNPEVIFGRADAMKLRSSLTLFSSVDASEEQPFKKCLDKFFFGMPDEKTLALLSQQN
jgi:uncharacterized protein (DUF1810 family)